MNNLAIKKPISSALLMCRPELKGFFYSPFLEFCFHKFFQLIIKGNKALWIGLMDSPFGNSALIVLPQSTAEMKKKSLQERERELLKGLNLAQNLGAKKIAFAGLLPSLLNHFQGLTSKELAQYKESLIKGQTMTCLAVVQVFEKLLKQTDCQTLSLMGLGAIGSNCLHLFLEKLAKPKKIILCDVLKRKALLQKKALEIQKTYHIPTDIALYEEDSFLKIYEGDFILGAVSSKNILNPWLLKPGAVLVDDSFPPLVSIKESVERMKKKKDILILSGGRMKLSFCTFHSPLWQVPKMLLSFFIKQFGQQGLPGCWLEALLSEKLEDLLNPKLETKAKSETEDKIVSTFEESKEHTTKPLSLKYGSKDKQPLKTEFTGQLPSLQEKLLKVWDLKESLDLILPDYHLFKYKIPSETVNRVLSLRKSLF